MTAPPANPMHDSLRDRILRRIEALPQDRQYQVLDYIEFLESKYAERQAPGPNVFQRFAEGVEDTLRAGNVSATTVAQAMGFLSQAMGVLGGVAAAGRSVAGGVAAAGKSVAEDLTSATRPREGSAPKGAPPTSPPASGTPSGGPKPGG
jgi:hypothetical protein